MSFLRALKTLRRLFCEEAGPLELENRNLEIFEKTSKSKG
jgi:hypothetical protein